MVGRIYKEEDMIIVPDVGICSHIGDGFLIYVMEDL